MSSLLKQEFHDFFLKNSQNIILALAKKDSIQEKYLRDIVARGFIPRKLPVGDKPQLYLCFTWSEIGC